LLKQADVARMKQVEAAAREDDALAVALPFATEENQVTLRDRFPQFPAPRRASAHHQKQAILPREDRALRTLR
jgi:hypothetical protein